MRRNFDERRLSTPIVFWKAWTLFGAVLATVFGQRAVANWKPPRMDPEQVVVNSREQRLESAEVAPREVQRVSPDWLLLRLSIAETARELCDLLRRLEPSDDSNVTYAIASVLERTRFRTVKICAAEALAEQPTAPAQSWLIDLASDSDSGVHRVALDALAQRGEGIAQAEVTEAAHSSQPPIRVSAVIALLNARRPEAVPLAGELLQTIDHIPALNELVEALGASKDARALALFRQVLRHGPRDVRLQTLTAIGELGVAEGATLLEPYLELETIEEFEAAASSLAKLQGQTALPRLLSIVRADNVSRAQVALKAVAQLDIDEARSLLLEQLRSDEYAVLHQAIWQAGSTHQPRIARACRAHPHPRGETGAG